MSAAPNYTKFPFGNDIRRDSSKKTPRSLPSIEFNSQPCGSLVVYLGFHFKSTEHAEQLNVTFWTTYLTYELTCH